MTPIEAGHYVCQRVRLSTLVGRVRPKGSTASRGYGTGADLETLFATLRKRSLLVANSSHPTPCMDTARVEGSEILALANASWGDLRAS
jgi:hypothetical protein